MRLAGAAPHCVGAWRWPIRALIGLMRPARRCRRRRAPADSNEAARKPAPSKGGAKRPRGEAKPRRTPAMPLGERVGIQFDLAWSGQLQRPDQRRVQRPSDRRRAGVPEGPQVQGNRRAGRAGARALAALSKSRQDQVGWRMVDDKVTGAQIGLPTAQVPNSSRGSRGGTRWSSAQGQVQVETFRIREPGTTLATVFEQQKKEPANRKLEVNLLRNDFFILSGTQGLKKFYVRAEVRDLEIRGMTMLWDQATEGIMDPVVVVMSSAFAPFPGSGLTALMGAPPRRKVEYGTGIVVTHAGHILTDRQLTEGCNVIEVGRPRRRRPPRRRQRGGRCAAAGLRRIRAWRRWRWAEGAAGAT